MAAWSSSARANLHPALYYKGLLDACRAPRRARSAPRPRSSGSPRRRRRLAGRDRAAASVQAGDVVIATNGYTGDLTPALKRRVVPIASHIIATEELPADLAALADPERAHPVRYPARAVLLPHVARRQADDLRRPRAVYARSTRAISAPILHRYMTARFPQLRGVKVTHAWTGNTAFTLDALPHMGQQRRPAFLPRLQRQRRGDDDLSRLADRAQDRPCRELRLQLRYTRLPRAPALFRQSVVSAGDRRLVSAARPTSTACSPDRAVAVCCERSLALRERTRWISTPTGNRSLEDAPPSGVEPGG